ncbi:clathrin adaptor [Aureococcus anophagefferens]|uniref:Clathrin adaptor n=1 Tax=Aureococcus anophagefferens TaxID=44056 RepID=A0ABR1FQP2_AURAN
MGTRVHNLEAELFKREKGPLGSKWARKLVVVDGAKRTIRYHKPNEDKRKTPRKIFRLANMSLVPSASGPKNAPAAFALTCSETALALLGIQLRLLPSVDGSRKIVVLTVKPTCPARDVVAPGDALTGIRGEPIEAPAAELPARGGRASRAARPLTLTFSRLVDHDDAEAEERLEAAEGEEDEEEEEESEDDPDQCGSFGEDEETKDAASALDRTQELELLEAAFAARRLWGSSFVLARSGEGRLALQLNEIGGDCGCFKQLQVFDEVTHVDGALPAARRPRSARLPGGSAAPSGRRAPAAALQPNDDQLVAVHGRLLPRDCTKEVFEDMMKALKKAPRPLRLTFWRASLGGADVLSGEAVEEEALLETMDGSVQDSLDAAAAAQDSLQDIAQGIAKAAPRARRRAARGRPAAAAAEYDDMHHQDGATPLGRPGAASDGEAEASDDDAGEPEEEEEARAEAPRSRRRRGGGLPEKAPEEAAPVEPASKLGAFLAQTPANDGSRRRQALGVPAAPRASARARARIREPAAVEAPAEPRPCRSSGGIKERLAAIEAREQAAFSAPPPASEPRAVGKLRPAKVEPSDGGGAAAARAAAAPAPPPPPAEPEPSPMVELGKRALDRLQSRGEPSTALEMEALGAASAVGERGQRAREKDNVARELEEVAEDARHYRSRLGEAERASRASGSGRGAEEKRSVGARGDELATVLEREREAAAARATAKIAEEAKARLEADATARGAASSPASARESPAAAAPPPVEDGAAARSWTATSRASSPAWTWPAAALCVAARRAGGADACLARAPSASAGRWCAPDARGAALAALGPGDAEGEAGAAPGSAGVASVALRHTDAWFDRPIEAPVLSPPAKALPWTFGSAAGARTSRCRFGLGGGGQLASPLSPRPADDGELELAGELAYACGAGAPLDRRGAALAKVAASRRARSSGARAQRAPRNLPAAVVFDADAPWAAPGAAGAALEALLRVRRRGAGAAVGASWRASRPRRARLNDALRKLVDLDVLESSGLAAWRAAALEARDGPPGRGRLAAAALKRRRRLFDWLDGRDDEDLDDDVDDDEEEDHGSVAEAPRAPWTRRPAESGEGGCAAARNSAVETDDDGFPGSRRRALQAALTRYIA